MNSEGPRYAPLPTVESDLGPPICSSQEQDDPPDYQEVAGREEQENCELPVHHPSGATAAPMPPPSIWGYKPANHEVFVPPSYEAATTLPTYDDVELEKENEGQMEVVGELFGLNHHRNNIQEPQLNGVIIGNDCLFFFAFLVAFFFNWIGLFIGYFMMYNLAGRYGAITGFGTSMIKWLMYFKYSDCCEDYLMNQHEYLYWIFYLLALVLIIKGVVSWIQVRRLHYMTAENRNQH